MSDEFAKGIMYQGRRQTGDQSFQTPTEKTTKVEWMASFQGIPIYTDASLPKGTIQFRDANHNVIGTITGIGQIRIGGDQ